jgi:tetratricopeptide (TPR) repeat protein
VLQQVLLARRFRKEIDAALALDPRDTQAWRDLLEFYLLAPGIIGGDARLATETAGRLRAIDPVAGLLAQARLAAFRKQPADAEASLRRAADAQPPSYRARVALAEFRIDAVPPRFDDARKPAEEALALDPGRVDAYAMLAEIHAALEQWTELEGVLAAAAKDVPDDLAPFYRAAVRLLASARDLPRAERYLRTYLAQPPEGNAPSAADARAQLRLVLAKEGRGSVGQDGILRPVGNRPVRLFADIPGPASPANEQPGVFARGLDTPVGRPSATRPQDAILPHAAGGPR